MVAGLALLGVFVRHESRSANPMIDLQLIRWPPLLSANMFGFIYGAAIYGGLIAFIPYYAVEGYAMSPAQSGAIATPRAIASASASTVSSVLMGRSGYRVLLLGGTGIVCVGLFLLGGHFRQPEVLGLRISDMLLLSSIMALIGIGMGTSGPAIQNAGLDLIPDNVAAIAGLRNMFINTGAVLGTAGYTLALSRFDDKGDGLAHIFQAVSLLLLVLIPLAFAVPAGRRRSRELAVPVEPTV
jgi:MFS family permease